MVPAEIPRQAVRRHSQRRLCRGHLGGQKSGGGGEPRAPCRQQKLQPAPTSTGGGVKTASYNAK